MNHLLLHQVVKNNNITQVINLLAAGVDVNMPDHEGQTPLFFAHDYKIAQLLVDARADINHHSNNQDTPLVANIVAKSVPVVQLLIASGAHINEKTDTYYSTPLHLAVSQWFENFKIVKFLIDAGADVNLQDKDGKTPLHIILQHVYNDHQNCRIIKLLLQSGSDVTIKDNNGKTPIDYAALLDYQKINMIRKWLRQSLKRYKFKRV